MSARIKQSIMFLAIITIVLSLNIVNATGRNKGVTDSQYANFRNVQAGQIGANNLYRSQHPANGSSRSIYANKFVSINGIRTVLNLSDSEKVLEKHFKKYKLDASSYYYKSLYDYNRVYTADMSPYHTSSSYQKKLVGALKFMAEEPGPYLIHCKVGRDRTGFAILLLSSLMGASYDYMLNDYAQSLVNINGYTAEKARTKAIKALNDEFHYMSGKSRKTDWTKQNLIQYAEAYLKKGGMTATEIAALKKNLSVSYLPFSEMTSGFYNECVNK